MKRLWVSGWAIPEEWFARQLRTHLPQDEHHIILPTASWFEGFKAQATSADVIAGYSFGAFLLLQQDHDLKKLGIHVELYAPFLDFKAESNRGSNITLTQLKFLKRWLSRKPLDAINDFYKKSGLQITSPIEVPYPLEDLAWGLDQMIDTEVSVSLLSNYNPVIAGNYDELINIDILRHVFNNLLSLDCNHSISDILTVKNGV
ncbi:MAG: hypothetical protein SGI98_12615 [Verrucomicrobiota bacterium]|nr:hypothetical protein [Verrucomicrobiota bacterium]